MDASDRPATFSTSDVGDAPVLPELLDKIAREQAIASLTGDGAFDTHGWPGAIAARRGRAIMPPRQECEAVET